MAVLSEVVKCVVRSSIYRKSLENNLLRALPKEIYDQIQEDKASTPL